VIAESMAVPIEEILENIKSEANAVPKLVKDATGVLPIMLDETKRELALTKQRGVYTDHLQIDEKLQEIEKKLNDDIKSIMAAETEGVKEDLSEAKDMLNSLNEDLERENRAFKQAKDTNDKAYEHIQEMEKVENYVSVAYDKESGIACIAAGREHCNLFETAVQATFQQHGLVRSGNQI
jgi:septation ring formation regulator EzrA